MDRVRGHASFEFRRRGSIGNDKGLTVLELFIAVFIVGLLAGLLFPAFNSIKRHAEKVKCMANLRHIHAALEGHLNDKNYWPQMPIEAFSFEESDYFKWWMVTLEPYGGGGMDVWLCPSDKIRYDEPERVFGSYIPTSFDAHRYTPVRWNQPWLMERGDFHGKGAHLIMPDGSIFSSTNPFGER
ncbi:MAG: hypothetical protein KDM91_03040 [Verrucomicrobiae bacterium]|nr:hypothetical protein [Verrucomicrobiae bacterium]MCB1234027.1 hypothetical protein [Verrucomicrobiae bacterium]MCP5539245.1 hypothetical protein [Akkermansiaceae bacterium]